MSYHCSDFSVDDHVQAVLASGWSEQDDAGPTHEEWASAGTQALCWQDFHCAHTDFFKPRRYLSQAFPSLIGRSLALLEAGCGSGSSALPLLADNSDARVAAFDVSPAALAAAQRNADAAGLSSSRFFAFQGDPLQTGPHRFRELLFEEARAHGWSLPGGFDAALAVFVLSALAPSALPTFVASLVSALRPGGQLLVRDYGLYDMPMLRFSAHARRGPGLYQREDGTLARFFDLEQLVADVIDAARDAGVLLCCEEHKWCAVSNSNRKTGVEMRRVFVHAVFRRNGGADEVEEKTTNL